VSLVGSRVNLTHRCTIQRDTSDAGGWNVPGPPEWDDHLEDVPCRVWAPTGREDIANDTTIAPVTDVRLIVPLGTDVTTSDRILEVTSRGATIQPGPLGIRAVIHRQDHLELLLVEVS